MTRRSIRSCTSTPSALTRLRQKSSSSASSTGRSTSWWTRLKNTNQLAGFTKRDDLAYFVEELVHARYVHDKLFAPAPTMMERYIHGNIGWDAYADAYREDMREREAVPQFFDRYGDCESVALVGTATRSRRSHVEVLAEMLEEFQKE